MSDFSGMTPSNTDIVVVEWEDIQSADNWNDDEVPETYGAKSVGWLLEDSAKHVILATSYSDDDERWSGYLTIPKLPPTVVVVGRYDARGGES